MQEDLPLDVQFLVFNICRDIEYSLSIHRLLSL